MIKIINNIEVIDKNKKMRLSEDEHFFIEVFNYFNIIGLFFVS